MRCVVCNTGGGIALLCSKDCEQEFKKNKHLYIRGHPAPEVKANPYKGICFHCHTAPYTWQFRGGLRLCDKCVITLDRMHDFAMPIKATVCQQTVCIDKSCQGCDGMGDYQPDRELPCGSTERECFESLTYCEQCPE